MGCRVSPNSGSNPGSPWKFWGDFSVLKPKHRFGLCDSTVDVSDTEPHIFVWFVVSNLRHSRFVYILKHCNCRGSWGPAEKAGTLALLLIYDLLDLLLSCSVTPCLEYLHCTSFRKKRLFLAHGIHGIIWISICFCDKNSKETRKPLVNTWCIPVRRQATGTPEKMGWPCWGYFSAENAQMLREELGNSCIRNRGK